METNRRVVPWYFALPLLVGVVWLANAHAAEPAPTKAATKTQAPLVAAASDAQFALTEIVAAFAAQEGQSVRAVFGSSGTLRRQIAAGAPFALFLSADEAYVLDLAREGFALDEGVLYAEGRVALFLAHGARLKDDATLRDLAAAIDDGRLKRLAIANPDHAPYGRAAREVLMAAGLWEKVVGKLVWGENVAQAAQFVASGSAQAGIVAHSLAFAPHLAAQGRFVLLAHEGHKPLRQRMALLRGADATTRSFYLFLQGILARGIFARHGFDHPGGT